MDKIPSQSYLKECLIYDPDTGIITWIRRPREHFKDATSWRKWNTKNKNKRAFTAINSNGYYQGGLDGKIFLAHRIIFKLIHGYEPDMVDHKDGVRTNNKSLNLLPSNNTLNQRNKKISSANKSSRVIGVTWHNTSKKWLARIKVNNKQIHLGYFDDLNDAKDARKEAEEKYNFSSTHGRES